VLVTRPEPGAGETAARLVEMGFRPLVAPMLRVRVMAAEMPAAGGLQAVLVTSGNALAGLPAALFGVRLLTVGAATAARARGLGFTDVHSADGDAADLAVLARDCCDVGRGPVLLAHGAGHGDTLAEALAADGFEVRRATVYEAHAVDRVPAGAAAAWCGDVIGAALFFSAETARAFVGLIEAAGWRAGARGVVAGAIGAAAAAALAPLPWRQVRVADRPDQEAMLALLK
jgi:uroporphyrinogen-III synthase